MILALKIAVGLVLAVIGLNLLFWGTIIAVYMVITAYENIMKALKK